MARAILLVGGAPKVKIDAIRFITVNATGATAVALFNALAPNAENEVTILLNRSCNLEGLNKKFYYDETLRFYETREELEAEMRAFIAKFADSVIVMSAAVNDYQVASVQVSKQGQTEIIEKIDSSAKISSGADEFVIKLVPASKLIDKLRGFGHTGKLVGFKFEASDTVIESAKKLMQRTQCDLVVANSLCRKLQALLKPASLKHYKNRQDLISALATEIKNLSTI